MIVHLHPDIRIQRLTFGVENAPLLVIDNFVANPERLVKKATVRQFSSTAHSFPGVRAQAPADYNGVFEHELRATLVEFFQLENKPLSFSLCHYSLVTTPAAKLGILQRIPHFDSFDGRGLASVHYLFKANLGGTAFYRHRKTGFEYINESRKDAYFNSLESENDGPNVPPSEYINGSTPLFEQIAKQEGVFNRMLIYRRNSLHSGCIDKDFVPDTNPLTGRLSINSFID